MIKIYKDNIEFLNQYNEFLFNDEVQYSLMLGISHKGNPTFSYFESKIGNRFLLGVLAGKNLIIASNTLEDDVYVEMINHMDNIDYPGIIGTREFCDKYNNLYKQKYGSALVVKMNQRIYFCDHVNDYSDNIGEVRLATLEDVDLLKHWALDFYSDIESDTTLQKAEESVLDKIERGVLYVLIIDNNIVSMTTRARSISKTETVSFVYTPQEFRRKGYASRIVEEVTRYILSEGRIATLYTDLDNPISNSIYMKIGYQPHCDSVMLNK